MRTQVDDNENDIKVNMNLDNDNERVLNMEGELKSPRMILENS